MFAYSSSSPRGTLAHSRFPRAFSLKKVIKMFNNEKFLQKGYMSSSVISRSISRSSILSAFCLKKVKCILDVVRSFRATYFSLEVESLFSSTLHLLASMLWLELSPSSQSSALWSIFSISKTSEQFGVQTKC